MIHLLSQHDLNFINNKMRTVARCREGKNRYQHQPNQPPTSAFIKLQSHQWRKPPCVDAVIARMQACDSDPCRSQMEGRERDE